jgi:hypothetical protein
MGNLTSAAWAVLSLQETPDDDVTDDGDDVTGHISTISTLVNSCQVQK